MSLNKEQKKQLKEWGVNPDELEIKEKKSIVLPIIIFSMIALILGLAIGSELSDTKKCNEEIINKTRYAADYGMQYTLEKIYNESITCNPIPLTNKKGNITLIAVECLKY